MPNKSEQPMLGASAGCSRPIAPSSKRLLGSFRSLLQRDPA
jgi:hypothetical protein